MLDEAKQAEELAKEINRVSLENCSGRCLDCKYMEAAAEGYTCVDIAIATGLTAKSYRKASEIFEELERFMSPYRYPIIADLRKKYLGEDINVPTNTEESTDA